MESKVFLCQKQRWLCRYTMWRSTWRNAWIPSWPRQSRILNCCWWTTAPPTAAAGCATSWRKKDGRVRVIHQKNQGLGGARNTGIQQAQGDWLLLVDSDDWIEPQTLEKTMEAGLREEADLVMFAYRSVDEGGRTLRTYLERTPPRSGAWPLDATAGAAAHLPLGLRAGCTAGSCWSARASSSRPGCGTRTCAPRPSCWRKPARWCTWTMWAYNYFSRTGSITKNQNAARNREIVEAFDDLLPWFQRQGLFEKYRQELCYLVVYHAYLTASVRVLLIDKKHPLLGELRAYLERWFPDWRQCPYLSRMSRAHRLLLSLLGKKRYGLVALLFQLKGRLG